MQFFGQSHDLSVCFSVEQIVLPDIGVLLTNILIIIYTPLRGKFNFSLKHTSQRKQ